MKSNKPTLDILDTALAVEISGLPAEYLAELQSEAKAAVDAARARQDRLHEALMIRYGKGAAQALNGEGKSGGTHHFADAEYDVKTTIPVTVSYDQGILAALWARMTIAGDNPLDYMKRKLEPISASALAAWPNEVRVPFLEARSEKPGKPVFEFKLSGAKRSR